MANYHCVIRYDCNHEKELMHIIRYLSNSYYLSNIPNPKQLDQEKNVVTIEFLDLDRTKLHKLEKMLKIGGFTNYDLNRIPNPESISKKIKNTLFGIQTDED